jgi:hypothetical protein
VPGPKDVAIGSYKEFLKNIGGITKGLVKAADKMEGPMTTSGLPNVAMTAQCEECLCVDPGSRTGPNLTSGSWKWVEVWHQNPDFSGPGPQSGGRDNALGGNYLSFDSALRDIQVTVQRLTEQCKDRGFLP